MNSELLKKVFYYSLRLFILVMIIFTFLAGNWGNGIVIAILFVLTYIPTWLSIKKIIYFPLEWDLLIIAFIFFTLFLGEVNDFYFRFWWWDIFLHTEAGFLFGALGFVMVHILNTRRWDINLYVKPSFVAFFAFCFSSAVAVVWEIIEFALDGSLGLMMQDNNMDTMQDLLANSLGAFLVALIGYGWLRHKLKGYFGGGLIASFIYRFVSKNRHLFDKLKNKD